MAKKLGPHSKNPNTNVGCKGYSFRHWNRKGVESESTTLNFSKSTSVHFWYSEPNEIRLAEVYTMMGDAVVIEYMSPARQLSCDPNLKIGVYHSLLYVGGIYYRYDPRLKRLKNTIDSPYIPGSQVGGKSLVNWVLALRLGQIF